MGAFDDLIPTKTSASSGAFDDLIPTKTSASSGAFDDLIPQAKQKRQVGFLEGTGRGLMLPYAKTTEALAMAGGGVGVIADTIGNLFTGGNSTAIQDKAFGLVDAQRDNVKYWEMAKDEELTGAGQIGNTIGNLAGIVQQGIATGGSGTINSTGALLRSAIAARAPIEAVKIAAPTALKAMAGVVPAFALPESVSRSNTLMENGVDSNTALQTFGTNLAGNTALGVLPVGMAGGLLKRAVTGGAVAAGTGAMAREVESLTLGDQYKDQQQEAFSLPSSSLEAGIGAVVSALLGKRGAPNVRSNAQPQTSADVPLTAKEIVDNATVTPDLSIADVISQATGAKPNAANPQEQAVASAYEAAGLNPDSVINSFSRARVADQMDLPESVSTTEKQADKIKEVSNKANDVNTMITSNKDGTYSGGIIDGKELIGEGSESTVYRDGDKVIKVSEPYNDKSQDTYNERVESAKLVNNELGDGSIRELDSYESTNGTKNPVFEMNYIEGRPATKAEIQAHMESRGYSKSKEGKYADEYTKTKDGIEYHAKDLDGDNVKVDKNGDVKVIDATISKKKSALSQEPVSQPKAGEKDIEPLNNKEANATDSVADNTTTVAKEATNDVKPLVENLIKQGNGVRSEHTKAVANAKKSAKQLMDGEEVSPSIFKNLAKTLKSYPDIVDTLNTLENIARTTPAMAEKARIKSENAKKALAERGRLDTTKDDLFQAMAKEGGVNIKEAIAEFGLDPADIGNLGHGIKQSFHNSGNSKSLDTMREHLLQKGYPVGDTVADFGNIIQEALKGDQVLTPEGHDAIAKKSMDDYYANQEDMARDSRQNDIDRLMREADDEMGAGTSQNIDIEVSKSMAGKSADEIEIELIKVLEDEIYIAKDSKRNNANIGNAEDIGTTTRGTEPSSQGVQQAVGVEAGKAESVRNNGNDTGQREPDFLKGESPDELKAKADDIAKREAQLKADQKAHDDKVAADKAEAERVARQKIAADSFDLTSNGSDAKENAKQDTKTADNEFAGQKDIFDTNVDEVKKDFGNGGTTLYSGIPLDKMYEAITGALKKLYNSDFVNNNMKEWKERTQAFAEAEIADKAASGSKDGGFVRGMKLAYRGFDSLITGQTAILSSIAKRHNNSPTINKIVTMFNDRTGTGDAAESGVTYYQEVEQHFTTTMNDIAESIGDNRIGDSAYWTSVVRRIKSANFDNTEAGKSAKKIADIINKELGKLRESGVDIGESKNYFPDRELNEQQVIGNQAAFTQAATKAYMKNGMQLLDAKKAAEAWLQSVLIGDSDASGSPFMPQQSGSPDTSFIKKRSLSNDASQILRDAGFYYDNPLDSLTTYFYRTSRKTAYENRFGGKTSDGQGHAKWREIEDALLAENNGDAIKEVRNMMRSLLGEMPSPNAGDISRKTVSFLQSANVITYLSGIGTLLTSLPEQVIGAARTGNIADVPKTIYYTARNVAAASAKKFGLDQNWAKSLSSEQAYEAAEMIGAVSHRLLNDTMLHNRLGGNMTNKKANLAVQTALRWNGLQGLTRAQRAAMIELGAKWMNTLAKESVSGKGGKLNELSLAELGVPKDKQVAFSNWLNGQSKAEYGGIEVGKLNSDAEMNTLYRNALYKFNSQTIMNPNRGQQPRMASHPVGKVAYGLLSYTFAYTDAVLKRSGRLLKEGVAGKGYTATERMKLLTPAVIAAGVIPLLQYALMPMRDEMNGTTDEQKQKRLDREFMGVGGDKIEAIQRSGVLGKYDPLINLVTGLKYNRDMSNALLGATAGGLAQTTQAGINLAQSEKNSANTNTAERAFTNNAWATLIEPTIVYNSIRFLPSAIGVPVQLGIKNKQTREAVVDVLAGKKKGKNTGGLQDLSDGLKDFNDGGLKDFN